MPQLNPEFFISQLFWLAVFFTFLFVFLWKISLPRIANVLEKRQNKIDENLSMAKELQKQAQEIEKKINDQISLTKQATNEQIKKVVSTLNEDVESHLSELDIELEEKISRSEKELLKKRDQQLENINNEILNITKITVSKIANINLSNTEVSEAIKTSKATLN